MEWIKNKLKTKQLVRQAIMFSICGIKDDIENNINADENKTRAEAISILAEAYKNVK